MRHDYGPRLSYMPTLWTTSEVHPLKNQGSVSRRWGNGYWAGKNHSTQHGAGTLGPKSISEPGLRTGKALWEGHAGVWDPAKHLDASGQVQLFLTHVSEHRSQVKTSRRGRGHPGSSVSDKGGTPDWPRAEASGCKGALTAVSGRGPCPGTLDEQQE